MSELQKRIALFDIDKTIYDGYLIFPLAEYFAKEQIIGKDIVETLYQDLHLYRSGNVNYETSVENFNMHMAYGLKSLNHDSILKATAAFLHTREGSRFFPFAEHLIAMLKKTYDIYIVTGEMQFVGSAVADYFSVTGYISTEMEVENAVFTGKISRSLARKEGKSDAVEGLIGKYAHKNSLAFGDSEGDIEMLEQVEHAFCINPTDGLRAAALLKGWNLVTPESIIEEVEKMM